MDNDFMKRKFKNLIRNSLRNLRLMRYPNEAEKILSGPVISVVIPIYDRTDLLRISIESVLNQEYDSFELILVCDGSPVETIELVREYLEHPKVVAYFLEGNSGNAVRARNVGIANSKGKYIAFLDSDDICTRERFSISVAILENESVDVIYGSWVALMDGSRKIDGLMNGQIIDGVDANFENLWEICVPCQSTVTVRKELFQLCGLVKPEMNYREDHELWLRLAYFGAKFRNVKFPFTHLRLHSGNNEINFEVSSILWLEKLRLIYMEKGPSIKDILRANS
jgi:glycosyltransferase involved in cell wall biosynthesis